MHSFTVIHESRDLKQARPYGQYVDLLRLHARYSLTKDYYSFFSKFCQCPFLCLQSHINFFQKNPYFVFFMYLQAAKSII